MATFCAVEVDVGDAAVGVGGPDPAHRSPGERDVRPVAGGAAVGLGVVEVGVGPPRLGRMRLAAGVVHRDVGVVVGVGRLAVAQAGDGHAAEAGDAVTQACATGQRVAVGLGLVRGIAGLGVHVPSVMLTDQAGCHRSAAVPPPILVGSQIGAES